MKSYQRLNNRRERRAFRVSNAVKRYSSRPRLCVFRSNKHIYAQIIDDAEGKTLAAVGTKDIDIRDKVANGGNVDAAIAVGEAIAKKALSANIMQVAFDRHGFKYHGRVKQLADSARKAGLDIGAMPTEEDLAKKAAKVKTRKSTQSGAQKKQAKEAGKNKAPAKKK